MNRRMLFVYSEKINMVFDIKSASKKHFSVWLLLKYKKLLLPIIIGSLLIGIGLIIFSQPRYYGGYQEHPTESLFE